MGLLAKMYGRTPYLNPLSLAVTLGLEARIHEYLSYSWGCFPLSTRLLIAPSQGSPKDRLGGNFLEAFGY